MVLKADMGLSSPGEIGRDKDVSRQKRKCLSFFTGRHLLDIQFITDLKSNLCLAVTE